MFRMDSIFNKIKSSVSEVLSGNPLSGDFEIRDEVIGLAGADLVWRIHPAQKKNTKEVCNHKPGSHKTTRGNAANAVIMR